MTETAMSETFYTPRLSAPDRILRPTWLELFFDLVFAAAISSLGKLLGHHLTLGGVLAFVALFHAVYWVWVNHTVFSSRFQSNDLIHRLLTFGLILSAAAMAVQIPVVLETGGSGFVLAYLGAQGLLVSIHLRPLLYVPEARGIHTVYFIGTGLSAAAWLASLFVPAPLRYGCWGLGMCFALAFPWFDRPELQRFPVNATHLPERLALFVLIVLGESIFSMVDGLSRVTWGPAPLAAAALACAMAGCLWWAYFSYVELAEHEQTLGTGMPYIFAHLPLIVGLTTIAVGLDRLIPEAFSFRTPKPTLALLGVGSALWIASFLVIQILAEGQRIGRGFAVLYLAAAGLALLIAAGGAGLPPVAVLAAIVCLMAGLLVVEIRFCQYEIGRILSRLRESRAIPRVSPAELAERITLGEPVTIWDVRRHPDAGQIPGSVRVEPERVLRGESVELPFDRDRLIIAYCS